MRPVRLEAEGFTCYRERQEPLDFSGLSLFAIAGPTGAGKSSILDTILYALYGEVPRIGKQGIGEFIAHGRDAMFVCLDFTVRGALYRVTRRVKRGKKNLATVATLAELVAGGERSIADGVKPVNEAIERLLGLDFNAFTQTVILPQGEFARFLRAAPTDQRGILQHLLRHEVFERMRAEAERRRGESERDAHGVERQLIGFEHATPEALAEIQKELVAARTTLQTLSASKMSQEAALQDHRVRHQLTMEVQALRASRVKLDTATPKIAVMRDELSAARRAAEIVPRLEVCAAAAARLQDAVRERVLVDAAVSSQNAELIAAEQRVAATSTDAAPCAELTRRIRALDEIKGDLGRRDVLRHELDALTRSLPVSQKRAAQAAGAAGRSRTAKIAADAALVSARAILASSDFDAAEQQLLDDLWTTVVQVRSIEQELVRLRDTHQSLDAAVQRAERTRAAQEKAFAAATLASEVATAADVDAATALEQGRARNQAAAVREHLHVGDACPVCLQTVVLMPPIETVRELDGLATARDQARARLASAQTERQAAGETRATARADVDNARQSLNASSLLLQQKAEAGAALRRMIAQALAGASADAADADVLAVVEARRSELRAARQARERAAEQVRVAEASVTSADLALVKADADLRAAADEQRRLTADEASCRAEYDALVARITAVSTHADPSAERTALAQRVQALESALRTAQDALAEERAEVAAVLARLASAVAAVEQAEASAVAARSTLDAAVRQAGFAHVGAVESAVRTSAQQAALDDAVRRHESEHAAVMTRLLEVEPRIADREVSAEALAAAEAECTAISAAWRQADLLVSALGASCERLVADVARRADLNTELSDLRGRLALHAGMAADLKGDAFQEYLLEEAFHSLVAGASVRLRQMSGRYTLEWDDSNFFVVDHDNASERRRAETLSGGETFMASLCLALQLSDEVLKTSGALQMDSLFIDEGFGTLDADSLGEVTDAMEALRQDGARLIGVISHRPELTERLPGCIRVVKGAGESTWQLERVG